MDTLPPVAVVGAGYFGRFHARHYAAHPGCRLAAVVDADAGRARAVAAEFGGTPLDTLDALPEGIVAASVAVPTALHGEVAGRLLARGVHVLVEKPIAASRAEADALEDLAARNGRVLQVGHVERFSAAFAALRETCRGAPRFMEARRFTEAKARARDVDVVLDLMIHDIDLALDLAAAPVVAVDATGAAYLNPTLDACQARLSFANGVVADLSASRVAEAGDRTFRVHHDGGVAVADLAGHVVSEAGPDADGAWRIRRREIDRVDALAAEIDEFIAAVRGVRRPRVDGRAGRDALAVALAVVAAATRRQSTVHLDRSA